MELATQNTQPLVLKAEDLQSLNDLQFKLEGWKRDYSVLKISGIEDKENRELVRRAIGVLRGERTGLEDKRKLLVSPYNQTVDFINDKFKDAKAQISAIEEPLKAMKKQVDDEEEEIKERKKAERAQRLNNRVKLLSDNGCSFDGDYYSIKDEELGVAEVSLGIVDLESMSDELFDKIIADVISKNTFIQTKRAEMEKLRLEEEERQKEADRLERERVAEESRKLQDKVDKMNEQVFSFRLKQLQQVAQVVFDKDVVTVFGNVLGNKEYVYSLPDEEFDTVLADLTKKAEQKAEEEKEKAAREAKLKERVNVLLGIGFVPMPSNTGYVLSAFSGKKTLYLDQLQSFSPEQFDAYLDTIAGFISESKSSEIKYNAGKERVDALKLIEAYSGQDFIEIGSLSITEWNGLYNKEKAAYDKAIQDKIEAKLKKEKEDAELLKIQEQEKASDKEKWANFISQLSSLKLPVMSNSTYRNKLKIAKEKIDEIINL